MSFRKNERGTGKGRLHVYAVVAGLMIKKCLKNKISVQAVCSTIKLLILFLVRRVKKKSQLMANSAVAFLLCLLFPIVLASRVGYPPSIYS